MIKFELHHDWSNTWRDEWRSGKCIPVDGVNIKVSQSTPEKKWRFGVRGILQTRDHVLNANNDAVIYGNERS